MAPAPSLPDAPRANVAPGGGRDRGPEGCGGLGLGGPGPVWGRRVAPGCRGAGQGRRGARPPRPSLWSYGGRVSRVWQPSHPVLPLGPSLAPSGLGAWHAGVLGTRFRLSQGGWESLTGLRGLRALQGLFFRALASQASRFKWDRGHRCRFGSNGPTVSLVTPERSPERRGWLCAV